MDSPPEDNGGGEEEQQWGLVDSFYIDTDGYTDRDRLMFVCGFEISKLLLLLSTHVAFYMLLHKENDSRARMICGQKGRLFTITYHSGYDGCETWIDLHVHR